MTENHKRYCATCTKYQAVEGGSLHGRNNNHWRCAECIGKVKRREFRKAGFDKRNNQVDRLTNLINYYQEKGE